MKTIFFYFLVVIMLGTSCTKVPNDGIPSYIKLNRPTIENSSIEQGSTIHQFTDLWIESDGTNLGAYEYPAIIPTLIAGENEVNITPGIYYNEDITDRTVYVIYDPYIETINFKQEDTVEITPIFKYRTGVEFLEVQDFENSNNFSNMLRTNIGDVENLENKAGIITLQDSETTVNSSTITSIAIPNDNTNRTFIEFSFKTESFINIGFQSAINENNYVSLAIFPPTKEWHTTYFEVSEFVATLNENEYHFYIDVQKNNIDQEEKTYFDNFKIIQY